MAATVVAPSGQTWGEWVVSAGVFRVDDSKAKSSVRVGQYILEAAVAAVEDHGSFSIALSGGSQPQQIRDGVAALSVADQAALQGDKWIVMYADERCVGPDHEDSNFKGSVEALEAIGVPASSVIAIDVSVGDTEAQAVDSEKRLLAALGAPDATPASPPRIDLVLLGMGPDGHTASLFPGHPLLGETERLIAPITDSPKPPPKRITMTLPLINAAARVAFTATGAGKADAIAAMCSAPRLQPPAAEGGEGDTGQLPAWGLLPAGRVQPVSGELAWFVDAAAVTGTMLEQA